MILSKKLAIFDLDGTLFNTNAVNFSAYDCAIRKCGFKAEFSYSFYMKFCNGSNYKVFLPQIVPDISKEDMEKVHEYKKQAYKYFLDKAIKNEHIFAMIECIKRDYIIALATTASRKNTKDILHTFNVEGFFDMIITQEDVKKMKPDPECFIKAMSLANADKKDTVIFEDSEAGIQAAEASGASYVRVYGFN